VADKNKTRLRFSQKQYDMLMRCSKKQDVSEWNQWRKKNFNIPILLEGADFKDARLNGVNLFAAKMKNSGFENARLENAILIKSDFEKALLGMTHFENSNLCAANFENAFTLSAGPCFFARANLVYANFKGLKRFPPSNFNHANLTAANFEAADLQGSSFIDAVLKRANFEGAELKIAHLYRSDLSGANLKKTNIEGARLNGTSFNSSHLEGARIHFAQVDSETYFVNCSYDKETDFTGTGLDNAGIDPGLKAAFKNNIRRIHWRRWLDDERKKDKFIVPWLWPWPVKLFWWVTDYGSSTKRIIGTFFAVASLFCLIYWLFAMIPGSQSIIDKLRQVPGPDSITFGCMHTLARAFYFSVVTMTTLGFGDMHAAKIGGWPSIVGYLFLSVQVIAGYVVLGALITRLGILFTSESPAAEPASAKAKDKRL
jgi:uncharacterized protein YjbI with pentapeptide repeats